MKQVRKQNNLFLGKKGEDIAVSYLQKLGYTLLDRNFKNRPGEIDIICLDRNTVVFIEVKTRSTLFYGLPTEAVTSYKLHTLSQTAHYYKLLHPQLPSSMRIDVISIILLPNSQKPEVDHIKNVTLNTL